MLPGYEHKNKFGTPGTKINVPISFFAGRDGFCFFLRCVDFNFLRLVGVFRFFYQLHKAKNVIGF